MKKSANRSKSANMTGRKDVEAYLASAPEPHRSTLNKLRAAIRAYLPREATEQISYDMKARL